MNIWIFNQYAVTPEQPGGTRHFDLGKEWIKNKHKVTIFSSSFHYIKREEFKLFKKENFKVENYEGIRFMWIKSTPFYKNNWKRVLNMMSYSWRLYTIAKKIPDDKPYTIIGSSVHLLAVLVAFRVAKMKKAKFIFEVRDLWPQTLIDLGNFKKNNIFIVLLRHFEKFLYLRAEKIITLLPKADQYITKLGIPNNKIFWIPNGVDLKSFDLKADKGITNNDFIIMYVGAHGKPNALDVILDAAKIIQDKDISNIRFELIGDGPEKQNLIKKANKMKLGKVAFRDPVPKQKIPAILRKSKAFIICLEDTPLYKYGISLNKIHDYLASGKPIIFSGNSINNPVEKAKAGFTVPPRNPQALAKGIVNLYNLSDVEREKMGKRGREYVAKYHDIEKLADKFLEVIS